MTVPPDDLPRARSGRVPQWVHDEAAGRPTPSTQWRQSGTGGVFPTVATGPSPRRRPRVVRTRRVDRRPPRSRGRLRPAASLSPRRQRLQPLYAFFVVFVVVAGLGLETLERYPERVDALLADLPRIAVTPAVGAPTTTLPAAGDRPFPAPGVEEAGAPLGAAPVIAAPSGQYAFTETQTSSDGRVVPVAWSPCRPIHYVVNLAGAPPGFADQVVLALTDLSAATGLHFIADGITAEVPTSDRPPYLPDLYGDRWSPVLIAFSDEVAMPDLAGMTVGTGGYTRAQDTSTDLMHAVTGGVYLDTTLLASPGLHDVHGMPAYLPVLRHELAHLVGLGHIDDPTQLMNPSTGAVVTYQGGDLTGLAELGRGACAPGV